MTLAPMLHVCAQITKAPLLVPPIATLLAKSPDVERYRVPLEDMVCAAAPLGSQLEDLLMQRFPRLKVRQGAYAYGALDLVNNRRLVDVTSNGSVGSWHTTKCNLTVLSIFYSRIANDIDP